MLKYLLLLHQRLLNILILLLTRESDMDEVEFAKYHSGVKRGDIVGICGYPGWYHFI